MSTKIELSRDIVTGDLHFKGTVSATDMTSLVMDPFDRKVLDECGGPTATAADRLLGLELIFRRLAEQQPRDRINDMARQAGLPMSWLDDGKASAWPELERFAQLVASGAQEGRNG